VSTVHAPQPRTTLKPRRRRGALTLRPEGSVQEVSHQFEDLDQQNESYLVGMWAFLVTEIMFFGGLFFAYTIYRTRFGDTFRIASQELDWKLGFVNTLILLTSSLSMAFAVRNAQLARKNATLRCLAITLLCAFGFLGVKTVEYTTKWNHHLVPGPSFRFESHHAAKGEGHVAAAGQAA
jgi:cytochrome c oxidase subunit 3